MTSISVFRKTAAVALLPLLIAGDEDRAALRLLEYFTVTIRKKKHPSSLCMGRCSLSAPARKGRGQQTRVRSTVNRCTWPRISN